MALLLGRWNPSFGSVVQVFQYHFCYSECVYGDCTCFGMPALLGLIIYENFEE